MNSTRLASIRRLPVQVAAARARVCVMTGICDNTAYRHAFSALSLDEAGAQNAEDAIWGALRAVQETMMFARERQQWACPVGSEDEIALEQVRIEENRKLADLLRAAVGPIYEAGLLNRQRWGISSR